MKLTISLPGDPERWRPVAVQFEAIGADAGIFGAAIAAALKGRRRVKARRRNEAIRDLAATFEGSHSEIPHNVASAIREYAAAGWKARDWRFDEAVPDIELNPQHAALFAILRADPERAVISEKQIARILAVGRHPSASASDISSVLKCPPVGL
jgi:hypothetical protein